ncbi:MAG: ABC transporter permease [Defluviitaleaceae bacterium]|nr:ABC transporter permease [Defluviitaleaceae bacterium]
MTVFMMAIKRIMSQPINWVFIVIFPVIFSVMITMGNNPDIDNFWAESTIVSIGVVDQDNSALSQTLMNQLDLRFSVVELEEEEISNALTGTYLAQPGTNVAWVLVIREGFGEDILDGIVPQLDSYALIISDITILGDRAAQSVTRALMVLGTDDPATLALWGGVSQLDFYVVGETGIPWDAISQLTGMYGFVAKFMAFFIIRILMDDKLKGMPERLGVLPVSPRRIMVQGTLAAFVSTLIASVVLVWFLNSRLSHLPNPLHLFTILALFNLFTVAFVFALYSNIKNMAAVSVIVTMVANIFSMLGGLFWPLEMVPQFMQRVAWFTPTYWFGRGLRSIGEIGFEGFVMPVMLLLGFTIVAMLLGGWKRIQGVEE